MIKIPKNQVLWVTYYDGKGNPIKAIASDPARIKWTLYKIDGNRSEKYKTGKSPIDFVTEVGRV